MAFLSKLMCNYANRIDPKYLIVMGSRDMYPHVNWQRDRFKRLDSYGVKYEKFNSVMMVKHSSKELKEEGIKHFTIERW